MRPALVSYCFFSFSSVRGESLRELWESSEDAFCSFSFDITLSLLDRFCFDSAPWVL